MPAIECPRCFTELEYTGEWWTGIACECENCKGILADNEWLESNLIQEDYHRLRARVFRGSPGRNILSLLPVCSATASDWDDQVHGLSRWEKLRDRRLSEVRIDVV